MTALQTLAAHLAAIDGNALTAAQREAVVSHGLDNIGAWTAGLRTVEGRNLVQFCRTPSGPTAQSGDLAGTVATASALARLSEIDTIHLASTTTPGGIVVPAALTIAAARGSDAATLRAAIVAGHDAMIRLGLAIGGPTVLYRGIWPTYFATPFAVAAVTARLHGLDAMRTAHALAAALSFASPGVGHHNAPTTSRWFAIGNAARNGVNAAQAAAAGFTSDLALADGAFLKSVYGVTLDRGVLTADLGTRFLLDEVSFKPWCAARQTMAATQALKELLAEGLDANTIDSVAATVPPPMLKMVDHGVTAGDRASHLTSLPYHLALAACDPAAADEVRQNPDAVAPAVRAMMDRITVAADESLLALFPAAWAARIAVTTRGSTRDRLVTHIPGDPARPLSRADLAAKFRRFAGAAGAVPLDVAEAAFDRDGAAASLVNSIELGAA